MGIQGLLSYCLEHRAECAVFENLVDVSARNRGIEILVDFYSFEHHLLSNFWKSLGSCSRNPYLRFLGGEYGAFDSYVSKLVSDLKALDIHLVMFIDGAKGSSKVVREQKFETWKYRHTQDLRTLHDLLDVVRGGKRIEDLAETQWVRPVLLEIQVLQTLKECGCEVVQISCGEADYVLARNLKKRPKAYAILSNDSDYCIFEDCKFIPLELFDVNKDLNLGAIDQWLPEKPIRLMCGILTADVIAGHFEVHSKDFQFCLMFSKCWR